MTPPVMAIDLVLPFPFASLEPNARPNWHAKAKDIATYREQCRKAAHSARVALDAPRGSFPLSGPVGMLVVFILTRWGRRDADNLMAAFKAGLDGIVDAHILADDSLKYLRPIAIDAEIGPHEEVHVRLEGAA